MHCYKRQIQKKKNKAIGTLKVKNRTEYTYLQYHQVK